MITVLLFGISTFSGADAPGLLYFGAVILDLALISVLEEAIGRGKS